MSRLKHSFGALDWELIAMKLLRRPHIILCFCMEYKVCVQQQQQQHHTSTISDHWAYFTNNCFDSNPIFICITLWRFIWFSNFTKVKFSKWITRLIFGIRCYYTRHCHVIEHSIEASNGKFKCYVYNVFFFFNISIMKWSCQPANKMRWNEMNWKQNVKQLNAETKQITRLISCCLSSAFSYSSISCIE